MNEHNEHRDFMHELVEAVDETLPDNLTEPEIQTLIHMIVKMYGYDNRQIYRFLISTAKAANRVEKQLKAERKRLKGETG